MDKKKIRNENDKLFSLIVKKRDNFTCQRCGKPGDQVHHIFGRGYAVRWNLDNGVCLCFTDHILGAHSKSIKRVNEFHDWVRDFLGERYNILNAESNKVVKAGVSFMKENNERLKNDFERYYGMSYSQWKKENK